ncbi:MAG: hypothetical protein WCG52_11025, partial [bacterium]
ISQCQEFLPVASSFLQNKTANKLGHLIAGPTGATRRGSMRATGCVGILRADIGSIPPYCLSA